MDVGINCHSARSLRTFLQQTVLVCLSSSTRCVEGADVCTKHKNLCTFCSGSAFLVQHSRIYPFCTLCTGNDETQSRAQNCKRLHTQKQQCSSGSLLKQQKKRDYVQKHEKSKCKGTSRVFQIASES